MPKPRISFKGMATSGVQCLRPYQPGKPLSELEREYGIRQAIKLASNENPLGPSLKVQEAVREELAELGRYPDGNGFELKQALATRHDVPPSWITLGNGSNDVLDLIARAFLGPGRNAVFAQHAFAMYPIVILAVGAEARVAPAHDGRRGPRYGHDLEAMAQQIDEKTHVVFIANPNNPTGTWLGSEELKTFLAQVPDSVLVVLDEAYFEYVTVDDYPDSTQWLPQFRNLIVTRTFSKAYALAGLRVGYALCDPELADLLNRVRQPFNVNSLALVAAQTALADQEHLEQGLAVTRQGMQFFTHALQQLGLTYIPSQGNFVCVDVGRPASQVYEELLRHGVIVRPVDNYGLPNHLRITIGLPTENQRLVEALADLLGRTIPGGLL